MLGGMRRLARAALLLGLTGLGALGAGCASADAFEGGVLRKGDLHVRFGPVPEGWRRIPVDGADLAYRDDPREGSTLFDVHCHDRDGDAPLPVLTEHLIMGTTARDVQLAETLPFDGREVLHTLMSAKLDGVAMRYDLYVMKKDGCVYDVVFVAPPGTFEQGRPGFERFASGLSASSSAP
jgi:hypothetical protein